MWPATFTLLNLLADTLIYRHRIANGMNYDVIFLLSQLNQSWTPSLSHQVIMVNISQPIS